MTTHTPISEEELAEIEARANAAVQGPWAGFTDGTVRTTTKFVTMLKDRSRPRKQQRPRVVTVASLPEPIATATADERLIQAIFNRNADGLSVFEQDKLDTVNFIAHARADVPRLIAEIRRLRSELANLRERSVMKHVGRIRLADSLLTDEQLKNVEAAEHGDGGFCAVGDGG